MPIVKKSPAKKKKFLVVLAKCGVLGPAALSIGITRKTALEWRKQDLVFAENWEHALEDFTDSLIKEASRRGRDGINEPVYYQGKLAATKRVYSDNLLMFVTKGYRPDFKDQVQLTAEINIVDRYIEPLPPKQVTEGKTEEGDNDGVS